MTVTIPSWLLITFSVLSIPYMMILFFAVGAGMQYIKRKEDEKKIIELRKNGSEMAKIRY